MTDTLYRDGILQCVERYREMIAGDALKHDDLLAFLDEIEERLGDEVPFPLLKLNRWLGYVQGVIIERRLTSVEAERDWTRPLFRPLDFPTPTFCGWKWNAEDMNRLRGSHHRKYNESINLSGTSTGDQTVTVLTECQDAVLMATAAEAIRIWCERGMPGLNEIGCPAKS